jgi:hypothetical protein
MARGTEPPIKHPLVDDKGNITMPWIEWASALHIGDNGEDWTPTFTSLTETGGAASITGTYKQISNSLAYFRVVITPVTSTSSVGGTTYINNFPLTISNDGACHAVAGNVGTEAGMAVASTGRIYTPTWTNVTVPVTVCGFIEAR